MTIKRFLYIQYQIFRFMTGRNKLYLGTVTKSRFLIWKEMWEWILREGDINLMYYVMGLNLEGTQQSDFIGRKEILSVKGKVEKALKTVHGNPNLSYDILTKDKFITNSFFRSNNIPCIPHLGVITRGRFIDTSNQILSPVDIFTLHDDLLLKNTVLEAGEGILCCIRRDNGYEVNGKTLSRKEFENKVGKGIWLVQPRIHSHQNIRVVNDTALNTTRIVTVLDGDDPKFIAGFQSFATGNASTDTWSKGSVYVGINPESLKLMKLGYFALPQTKSTVTEHPDSHIVFENLPLPYMKDAIELCLKAHKLLYFNFIIGWDIAITDEGPVIVEANEKPGMDVTQCIAGGLRTVIRLAADKTIKSK